MTDDNRRWKIRPHVFGCVFVYLLKKRFAICACGVTSSFVVSVWRMDRPFCPGSQHVIFSPLKIFRNLFLTLFCSECQT